MFLNIHIYWTRFSAVQSKCATQHLQCQHYHLELHQTTTTSITIRERTTIAIFRTRTQYWQSRLLRLSPADGALTGLLHPTNNTTRLDVEPKRARGTKTICAIRVDSHSSIGQNSLNRVPNRLCVCKPRALRVGNIRAITHRYWVFGYQQIVSRSI